MRGAAAGVGWGRLGGCHLPPNPESLPLPMSEPFSSMPIDCPICSLLSLSVSLVRLCPSLRLLPSVTLCLGVCLSVSYPVSLTVSVACLLSLTRPLHLFLFLASSCLCLLSFSISYPFCFPPASLCLGVPLSVGPSPCTPISLLPPRVSALRPPPPPPGYEKSRSLSSIAGLSGVSLRLAPLATPPGSPRAARRAPPTLPSIL